MPYASAAALRRRCRHQRLAAGVLFLQQRQEAVGAAVGDDVLELRAEVRHQADPLDDDVDDLPLAIALAQAIVDHDVRAVPTAQDLGLYGDVAAVLFALA